MTRRDLKALSKQDETDERHREREPVAMPPSPEAAPVLGVWCSCTGHRMTYDKWPAICGSCGMHIYDEAVKRWEEQAGRQHPAGDGRDRRAKRVETSAVLILPVRYD